VQEQPFEVLAHPMVVATAEAYREQAQLAEQCHQHTSDIHQAVNQLNALSDFAKSAAKLNKDKELGKTAEELTKKIEETKGKLVQEKQKTFQDVINFPNQLNTDFAHLKEELDNLTPTVTNGIKQRFKDLEALWQQRKAEVDKLLNTDGKQFQKMVQDKAAQ
jgi:seryl-tRNA synthetase